MIYGKKLASLILLSLVFLSISLVGYSSSTTSYWDNSLTKKLLWILKNVIGVDTSKYRLSSVKIEGINEDKHTRYFIVQLKRYDNIVLEVGVVVDYNSNILEETIRNIIPDTDLSVRYDLKVAKLIMNKSIETMTQLNNKYIDEIIHVLQDAADSLAGNSSTVDELAEHCKSTSIQSAEIHKVDATTYRAVISITSKYETEFIMHSNSRVIVLYTYRLYHIVSNTTYRHHVLDLILKPLPSDSNGYTIYGVRYEPYSIVIYSRDKLMNPDEYHGKILGYVKQYLSENGKECSVAEIKLLDVYGKTKDVMNNTRIIHIYYSYLAKTKCNDQYVIHVDPVVNKVLDIEPYGYYNMGTNEDNNIASDNNYYVLYIGAGLVLVLAVLITTLLSRHSHKK